MTSCVYIHPSGEMIQYSIVIDNENAHGLILNKEDPRVTFAGQIGNDIVVCKALNPSTDEINKIRFNTEIEESKGPLLLIRMNNVGEPEDLLLDEVKMYTI